jgi:TonB family protein
MLLAVTVLAAILRAGGAAAEAPPAPAAPQAGQTEPVLATPPKLKALVPAEVPPGTVFPSPEVTVVLSLEVGADGQVEEATVESGAGEPFDSAALAAASRFEFEPGRLSTGEAVPVTVTFRMRIQAPAPPPPAPLTLAGRLLERGTRVPLPDVAVVARDGDRLLARATTDAEGRFTLEVPVPEFTVLAVPAGHQRLDAAVKGRAGERREEVYYLESTGNPNETVVSATPVLREVIRQTLTAEEVAKSPGTAGDTLKATLNLPGAARAPFSSGLVILRGSAPGDSQVFLEGQSIPILYHFGGIRSTIAPRFLESVEFVPGNFSTDYGRAQGGIIDVRLRDPRTDGFHGDADVNVYDLGVALEGPLGGDWSLGGAFRRSWIDAVLSSVIPSDANLSFDTAPRFYDFQLIATWKPPEGGQRVRLLFYGSNDGLAALFDRPQDDPTITGAFDAAISFYNLQADWESTLSPSVRQESSFLLGLQEVDTRIGPQYFFDLKVKRISFRSTWTWDPSDAVQVRGGIDLRSDRADVSLNVPNNAGNEPVPPSTLPQIGARELVTLYTPAAFADVRIAPTPNLSILPGVRIDWYGIVRRWTVDPRLLARWEVARGTVLKGAVGLYQQPPQPGEADASTGNPDLLPERSVQASLGIEQRIAEGVGIEVTGFWKSLDRQVVANPASNYDPAAPRYTNEGTGRIYGVETLLRASLGDRWSGFLAYTFQRSFRTDPADPERPFDFDQPHLLTVLGTCRIGAGWSTGARFRLVSGNPYTPVTGSVYDSATDVYVPLYGGKNTGRLASFWALDLRVDKEWIFDTWKLGLYLDVQNVTNRENQEGWTYSYDYSEKTALTGLPILPILGVKGEW